MNKRELKITVRELEADEVQEGGLFVEFEEVDGASNHPVNKEGLVYTVIEKLFKFLSTEAV